MARKRWFWTASTAVAFLAVVGLALYIVIPVHASKSNTSSPYSKPTWWAKFQTVSAPGFTPLANPGATKSVKVGANVDVSNEPGSRA